MSGRQTPTNSQRFQWGGSGLILGMIFARWSYTGELNLAFLLLTLTVLTIGVWSRAL